MTPIPVRHIAFPLVTIGVEWNYHAGQWRRYLLRKVPGTMLATREPLYHVDLDAPYCPCCLVPAVVVDGVEVCSRCGGQDRAHEGFASG
jgi:hypothetical protein